MTTEEYIAKQRRAFTQVIEKDIPLRRAAFDTLAKQVTRIFVEGKNTAGGNIGQYDTRRPLYINPDNAPRKTGDKIKGIEGLLPARGKHGDEKFTNGKPHKTTYVNNYKDFRNRIGRRIDRVDLFLSGDLKSDVSNSPNNRPEPIQVGVHEYHMGLKRDENVKKVDKFNDKYGQIFAPSQSEKTNFVTVAQKEFQLIILNA